MLARSPFRLSMPSGCQVRPAELRQRWLSASVGWNGGRRRRATGNRNAVELDSSRLSPLASRIRVGARLRSARVEALADLALAHEARQDLVIPPSGSRNPFRRTVSWYVSVECVGRWPAPRSARSAPGPW